MSRGRGTGCSAGRGSRPGQAAVCCQLPVTWDQLGWARGKAGPGALGPRVPSRCTRCWLEQDPLLAMRSGAGTLCCPLCHLSRVLLACWKPREPLTQGSGELTAGEREVTLVSSLVRKAETPIPAALGDRAAASPAPRELGTQSRAMAWGPPCCSAPQALSGQPGPSGSTRRGRPLPASSLENVSPCAAPRRVDAATPRPWKFDCSAFQIYINQTQNAYFR